MGHVGAERVVKSSLASTGSLKGSREGATCSILGKETKILVLEEMDQKGILPSRHQELMPSCWSNGSKRFWAMTKPSVWPDDADEGAETRTGIVIGISSFQNRVLTEASGLDQILQLWGKNPWEHIRRWCSLLDKLTCKLRYFRTRLAIFWELMLSWHLCRGDWTSRRFVSFGEDSFVFHAQK